MTITKADIRFAKSAVMDDVPEGGGAPTANLVADGVSNNLFNDISELDRAGGRVSLRKAFVSVRTSTAEGYYGANVIVADPPDDPNVAVTIFSTGAVFDTRVEAASRVEAYLSAGPEMSSFLYENHIAGQRSIQLFARANVTPPPVGRTLLLRKFEGNVGGTQAEQYVRVTRVTTEDRDFTYNTNQEYSAQVITCDLSDALRYDFPGTSANRNFARSGATIVRDTVVADAATYYGVVPLAQAVAIGDVTARCTSVYTQLVPNSKTETAVVDQRSTADPLTTVASTPRLVQVSDAALSQRIRVGQENRGFNYVTILTPLPAPGTVSVTYRALGRTYRITDDGAGNLGGGSGTGTVNYTTGSVSVTLQALPDDRSAIVFYWGQKVSYTNHSGESTFRAPEYSWTLEHQGVTPGSLTITWTSGGVVKTATASNAAMGAFSGDAVGEVIHISGAVFLRPTAMIDPGGQFSISYTWRTVVEETKTGLTPDSTGTVAFTLAQTPTAGKVEIQWLTTKQTSVTSGASSVAGTTQKDSSTRNSVTMVSNTQVHDTGGPPMYSGGSSGGGGWATAGGATAAFPAFVTSTITTQTPVVTTTQTSSSTGSTYSTSSQQTTSTGVTVGHRITDDSAGGFIDSRGTISYSAKTVTLKVVGDYTEASYSSNSENASTFESLNQTGVPTTTVGGPVSSTPSSGGGGSSSAKGGSYGSTSDKEVFGTNSLFVRYVTGSPTPASATETFTPPGCTIDIAPLTKDLVVPGSVQFVWMGTTYIDFEGVIYRGRTSTNPGIASGGIDYTTGVAGMFDYVVSGSPSSFSLTSLWTTKARPHIANVTFQVALAPVKPGGLVLSVVGVDGGQIIATANINGAITGTHTHGVIDFETGLVEVLFGDYVLDSSLTTKDKAEWWYSASDVRVADGKIWRPWPVDPQTLRYNAVSYAYLPLDASVLGLDPVRLPQDGRVPIFRPGAFAVLGNTQVLSPGTVSAGQNLNCGRTRLSRVRLLGANGLPIDSGYTENLEAGTLHIDSVSGWSQPITVEHRIEDMAMVSDVQINGTVSFTRQITHAYPAGTSYLSSALVAGDLHARTSLVFDQVTWLNAWSDQVGGSAATATFNNSANPITTTNAGTLTERWAIIFTSSTGFNVVGEHVGVIAVGNTGTDCAPNNPASSAPYFTIPAAGWGLGWANGNVLRFNTVGAFYPVWCVRTVQQGEITVADDSFTLLIRGDVDRP